MFRPGVLPMPLDSHQLAQFVVIADTGSFRGAAELLGIAQPALTVSIKKLEHALRAEVFRRTHHGVTLTPAGHALIGHARRMLSAIDAGLRAVQAVEAGMTGELRLGFVGTAACSLLPRFLPPFSARFPLVHIELTETGTPVLLDALDREMLDACIVRRPMQSDERYEVRALELDTLAAVLPSTHRLATRNIITLDDLREEPYIGFAGESAPFISSGLMQFCTAAGYIPRVAQTVQRVTTAICLVGCGLGFGLVPTAAVVHATPIVRFIPIETGDFDLQLRLSLVWLKGQANPIVKHLVDVAGG